MKIAVQFIGQLRSFVQPSEFFKKNLLNHIDCDIFLSTWESMPSQMFPDDKGELDKFLEIYQVTQYRTDKLTSDFLKDEVDVCMNGWVIDEKNVKVDYMVYGFYHKYMCNKLRQQYETKNNITYDIIITVRPDLVLAEPFPIELLEYAKDFLLIPAGSDWEYGTNDLLAIGNDQNMTSYCELFTHLQKYAMNGIMMHPEHLNKYNLDGLNVPIRRFSFTTHLRSRRMT